MDKSHRYGVSGMEILFRLYRLVSISKPFNISRATQTDHPGRPAISLVLIVLVVYFTFPETKGR